MLAHQAPEKSTGEDMLPQGTRFSKGYYSKKVNLKEDHTLQIGSLRVILSALISTSG